MEVSAIQSVTGGGGSLPPTLGLRGLRDHIVGLKRQFPASADSLDQLTMVVTKRFNEEIEKAGLKGETVPQSFLTEFFQEISTALDECKGDVQKIDSLVQDIKGCSFHAVVDTIQHIANGKVKDIYVRGIFGKHVYSVARAPKGPLSRIWGARNRAELQRELEVGRRIKRAFVAASKGDAEERERLVEKNLSLDFAVAEPGEEIQGQFTLKSTRATSDLERKFTPSASQTGDPRHFDSSLLRFVEQIIHGFTCLHEAGFVHGDPKLENCFYYAAGPEGSQVKIADWGKAQRSGPGKTTIYTGNPRYAAPEGGGGQTAEVFSVGVMLMRVFESQYLSVHTPMLVEPSAFKSGKPVENRVGFERFLVESKKCPQKDHVGLYGRVSMIVRRFGRAVVRAVAPKLAEKIPSDKAFREEVGRYVDALITKMGQNELEPDYGQLMQLHDLLMKMLDPDPAQRPTMTQVSEKYRGIMENIFPEGTSP